MGPIGFKELVVILIVVLLIFGAKKLKTIGSDLGSAVRGRFKSR
jgi:sec-independent protein translocase protein TatA